MLIPFVKLNDMHMTVGLVLITSSSSCSWMGKSSVLYNISVLFSYTPLYTKIHLFSNVEII